ncbi:hypothetical protein P4H66_30605 [Paenibacillus dokdonensis]|uniref:Uncharacterized protein n=1 Tax=Paenibacillus dokdonensis TaxID=2567944 RepID=A0ABU6GXP2_9BACL|nr:hypothetical protein [Paenibacillus dokdonensis]MEC0244168.1 hypothetical protein [Paenibacillus dokdonensis]
MTSNEILHYLPEEVPDHLFTQSRLSRMAYVVYPEQKTKYKLFDINGTQQRKQQKGLSLIQKNATVEQILADRKHEIEVRRAQLGSTT